MPRDVSRWVRHAPDLEPKFEAIVDPELSARLRSIYRGTGNTRAVAASQALGGSLGMAAASTAVTGSVGIGAVLGTACLTAWLMLTLSRYRGRHVVSGLNPQFRGVPIIGEGLAFVVDISERFAWAKRHVDALPDLLEWDELADAVEAIRWDAARHASLLTATEDDWRSVTNARPGSPQAVLRSRLERDRADHVTVLTGYQRTADRLMNHAADAVAAAKIAEREGYDLEIATPSVAASRAGEQLDLVIERLDALTAAWRALDPSTDLLAAELDLRDAEATERADKLRRSIESAIDPTTDEAP